MMDMGFSTTGNYREADVIFINTCSIRENAEQRVRNRLKEFGANKLRKPGTVIGVLGCMAERLKSKFLEEEQLVDVVVGPDAYRDLPNLIWILDDGGRSEEHTSELQSLIRISYAVFCLQNNIQNYYTLIY